jgi:outer membrane protein OmpA-like peptidoglycan-associated protein
MKNEIRMALLCMAAASAPAFAQNVGPECASNNFDPARNAYTVINPAAGAVNQQCYFTVHPAGSAQSGQFAAPNLVEGTYIIDLVGGGGGGGGGAAKDQGGGGGGAGAAPSRSVNYLAPGVYKMTIGTGGYGGAAEGGRTGAGNPTSLTNATTGQLIAGFAGADTWTQHSQMAGSGSGGLAAPGGSSGGSGGDSGPRSEESAQAGGVLQTPGYSGVPGQAGSETGRSVRKDGERVVQANAGGGGGASVGSGGTGESADSNTSAQTGGRGAGGGGGASDGKDTASNNTSAQPGGRGGDGLIQLTLSEAAPQAVAPAPLPVPLPVAQRYTLSTDTLFGFGKATLRPAGEAKLDELALKLRQVNIESITDTGHADRFGSQEFNQKLSVSRAESVKAYLVNKGVEPRQIAVAGRGESQPLTSADDCKGPATAKVVACLAPDRRVEIEVVGTAIQ